MHSSCKVQLSLYIRKKKLTILKIRRVSDSYYLKHRQNDVIDDLATPKSLRTGDKQ